MFNLVTTQVLFHEIVVSSSSVAEDKRLLLCDFVSIDE